MIKSLILVFFVLFTLGVLFIIGIFRNSSQMPDDADIRTTAIPSPSTNSSSVKIHDFQSSWSVVQNTKTISLYSNLVDQLSAQEAHDKYNCTTLINGGFFTEDGKHLGLFVTHGNFLSLEKQSSLFNGFFSLTNGKPSITSKAPEIKDIALQTGPLLMKDGEPLHLSMKNDENARRVVAAITNENQVVFLVFYNASSLVLGPTLEQLPQVLNDLQKEENLNIKDAINLDGGAHSAFISNEIQLTDIQTPGSYFCVKN